MQNEIVILDDDKEYACRRIVDLQQQIQALGPEFYEVFNQSSETWHDNAPFDALRDRQSVLDSELQQLRMVVRNSVLSVPVQKPDVVGMGTTTLLSNGSKYFIAGDWTPHAGKVRNGALVISRNTPLAQQLLGKRVGECAVIGRRVLEITSLVSTVKDDPI